ncbi:uncharacterized protein LOC111313459 [Durio zibethinus]|uniref:Uncharacterized protein LOC111313459 n=1 Tax=Durio zibethinus TaxID=66656 RepID=A0A6P6AYN4_DURZI|nr:uncharacterized protein LOC111313459 [Durio zibethinus]
MNTKTMRLPPRRVSMPNNKRKERNDLDVKHLAPPPTKSPKPAVPLSASTKAAHQVLSNQLLAGYLAHEFLTRGTLFGQTWDPARIREVEPKERSRAGDAEPKPKEEKHQRYVEVASLLKTDGAHIPGIVNPSQLGHFLQV